MNKRNISSFCFYNGQWWTIINSWIMEPPLYPSRLTYCKIQRQWVPLHILFQELEFFIVFKQIYKETKSVNPKYLYLWLCYVLYENVCLCTSCYKYWSFCVRQDSNLWPQLTHTLHITLLSPDQIVGVKYWCKWEIEGYPTFFSRLSS